MVLDYADPKRGAVLFLKVAVAALAAYFISSTALSSGADLLTTVILFIIVYVVLAYAMK